MDEIAGDGRYIRGDELVPWDSLVCGAICAGVGCDESSGWSECLFSMEAPGEPTSIIFFVRNVFVGGGRTGTSSASLWYKRTNY